MLNTRRLVHEESESEFILLAMEDVTEQRRAECALHDERQFAEQLANTVRHPLLVLNADFRVQVANHAFYETFHVSPDETEERLVYELGSGQWNTPELRRLLTEVLPQNASFNDFDMEHDFTSIGRRSMRLNARCLHRNGNRTESILLAIEDVTEQRRAEEARRELETHFTSLVKNIRDHSIFTLDPTGCITSWNLEAERILGYSEEEILGEHFSVIFTAEDLDQKVPQQELATAKEVGRAEDERWHRRKNGELLWALGVVTPTTDIEGRHTGYSKILRDMTDRRRTHEALLRQSQQLRTLWDSAEVLLTAPTPQVMMQEIFDRVSEHLTVDAYFYFLVNESGDHLCLVAYGGVPEDVASSIKRLEFGQAVCGTVALQRKAIIATNIQQSDDVKTALVKKFGMRTEPTCAIRWFLKIT